MLWCVICVSAVFCSLSLPTHAMGVYTKAGIAGVGVGYFHGVTEHLSLRSDFSIVRKFTRDFASRAGSYTVSLDANQWGIYGDWFPFGNGFRLSTGIHVRRLQVQAHGQPADGAFTIRFGPLKWSVKFKPEDTFTGLVKFPAVAPYLGIGWGYHDTQKPGLGFVFDLGVSFGKPSAKLIISDSLQTKIRLARLTGASSVDALLKGEQQKLNDTANAFKAFPQVYVGVSYRF